MRTGSAAVSEIPGQLYMMVVDNNGSKTGVRRAKSNASRQGIIVNTMNGAERHLHISGTTFRIPARYNNLKVIGKGSYGVVCSAVDSLRNMPVAIKKITPMAAHSTDAKHVLREVRVMRHLGQHENIVTLEDLFSNKLEDELYIVMELLDSDLHRVIQSSQVFTTQHHRLFMIQILRGVEFLHQNDVIHRDLKPGNILVTHNCELRISDFGLARGRPKTGRASAESCDEDGMTEHVVTRWYRPPELMLSPNGFYGFSVDIWSVGCIFGELIGRQPLFPGSGFKDQLSLIFNVLGAPAPEEIGHIRGAQAQKFLEQVKRKNGVSFTNLLPGINSDAASLLTNLLLFDPDKRCTASEALLHSFFEDFRNDDTLKGDPPTGLHFEFEHRSVSTTTLRDLIAKEVNYFQSGANLKIHKRREAHAVDSGRLCVPAVTAATTAAAAAVAATSAAFSTREDVAPANWYYSESPDGLDDSGGKRREPPPRPFGKKSPSAFPKSRYGGATSNTGKDPKNLNADSRRSSRRHARSSKAPKGPASVAVGGSIGAEVNTRVPPDLDEEDDDTEFYPWLTTASAAVRGEGKSWRENLERRKTNNDDDTEDKVKGNQHENAKCTTYCPARTRISTEGNGELCAIMESKEERSPSDAVQPEGCSGSSVAGGERGGKRETKRFISGTPMKPTRSGSVAGFPRGNDGWDEDADGSDPRTRARNSSTAVTVLSPASLRNVLLARGVSGCRGSSAKERSECRDNERLGNNLMRNDTGGVNDNRGDELVGEVDDAKASKDTPTAIRQFEREKRAWQLGRAKAKAETDAAARRQSMKMSGRPPRNVENGWNRASAPVLSSRVRDSQRLSAPGDARSGVQNDPATPWDGSGGCCSTETEAHCGGRGTASNPMEQIEEMCNGTCYGKAASEAVDSLRFRPEEVVASLERVPAREGNEGDFGGASWRTVNVSGDTRRLISGNAWRREVVGAQCEDGVGLGNCMVPPRAWLAPVDSDTVTDLVVPLSCAGNPSAGGQDSIESSRCSPPPVPPPLGHRWARHKQARYKRPADQGHPGCPRDDIGVVVKTIEEDITPPPPRQRLEEKAPLEITTLRLPIRAGRAAGSDAVERNRALASPIDPTEDPGDVNDIVLSTSTIKEDTISPPPRQRLEEKAPLEIPVLRLPIRAGHDIGVVVKTIEEDITPPPPRQRLEEKAPLEITALRLPIRAGRAAGSDAVERNRALASPINPTEDPGDVNDIVLSTSTIKEDTISPPPRQRLEGKAPLEIPVLRLPIRAGRVAGSDAVERNRALVSPINSTEDRGDVNDPVPSTSTASVVEPGSFYPSAAVARKETIEEDAPLVLKLPSRLLSPSTPTSTSTEASSDDDLCGDDILLPPTPIDAEPEASPADTSTAGGKGQHTPIVLRLPSRIREPLCERRRESEHKPRICPLDELARSSDDHGGNPLASAWPWSLAEERVRTGEAGKVDEVGSREKEINAGAPATSRPTGLSSEVLAVDRVTPPPVDDGPTTTMSTCKAPPLSTSLAYELPDVNQQEATSAGRNLPPPRRAVAKPWGVPVGEAVSAWPVFGISESTDEDRSESSVGSVEHKFNLLQRLWKRSGAGKRAGELDALSTHTSGPSVFDGTTAKGAGNEPSAPDGKASRTWVIQAAASIPMSQKAEFKEALTTASQNRMASNTTSILSPASSAASRIDAFYSAAPSAGSARASSVMSQPQAPGHRRELSATVPPLRVDFPLKRESPANGIRTGPQSIERRERVARESVGHGAETGRTRSDGVERRTFLGGDPCGEDQLKTPQCCAPPPSPPEAGRPSREEKREKGFRRVQKNLAVENPPVLPRRGTVAS